MSFIQNSCIHFENKKIDFCSPLSYFDESSHLVWLKGVREGRKINDNFHVFTLSGEFPRNDMNHFLLLYVICKEQ